MWLWNHPWIFWLQNLFDHPALHDAVQIKLKIKLPVCHSTGILLAAYRIGSKSAMSMVQGLPLNLAPYVFVMTDCTFQFVGPLFSFFKTLQTLALA